MMNIIFLKDMFIYIYIYGRARVSAPLFLGNVQHSAKPYLKERKKKIEYVLKLID